MATFESKVSDVFSENPRLARKIPVVIKRLFHESEADFKRRLAAGNEGVQQLAFLQLFDILFIDFYFSELDDYFLNWVIEHYPERFSQSELEEMRVQAVSHLDFYEVQEVLPGEGSYIKSIITGEEGFLRDISSSDKFVKWDVFRARCYRFRGEYYATGSLSLFKPSDKKFIIEKIETAMSEYKYDDFPEFAKDRWEIFFQIERDIREGELNKKIYTRYGELQLCEVRFKVKDLKSILKEIENHSDFLFVKTKFRKDSRTKRKLLRYEFDWITQGIEEELKPMEIGDTTNGIMISSKPLDKFGNATNVEQIGNLYVDQLLCRLEVRSREIADFAVKYFERIFGNAVAYKRTNTLKLDKKLEMEKEQPVENKQNDEVPIEISEKLIENYYMNLLDEPIPILMNKTPREAREHPELVPLLIDWLKQLENFEARADSSQNRIKAPIEKMKKALKINI